MTDHKPWAKPTGSATLTDAETDAIEAERVLTMTEIAALPSVVDQLEALDSGTVGKTIKPLTVDELRTLQATAHWFAGACMTARTAPPPDLLRAVTACAWQVVSYNVALANAGVPDAVPMPSDDKPQTMQ